MYEYMIHILRYKGLMSSRWQYFGTRFQFSSNVIYDFASLWFVYYSGNAMWIATDVDWNSSISHRF